ncbi:MAG: ribbon-helix-helix protein, CopG family [Armatimonadetes bacterium]|nr:ribbon-helix-helix protein, CopG family [Armatimonadota bacterium]
MPRNGVVGAERVDQAANAAARRHNVNRSELVRRTLREYLERLRVRGQERRAEATGCPSTAAFQ